MSLTKPSYCDQEWFDMTPTQGGKICGACTKKIVNCTKKSWSEIESLQKANNNSVCAIYSKRQLKYWGKEPPKRSLLGKTAIAASTLFFTLSQLPSTDIKAQIAEQLPIQSEQSDSVATNVDSTKTRVKTIIKGKVTSEDSEPVPFASIYHKGIPLRSTSTDFDGNYSLEFDIPIDSLRKGKLAFFYSGYSTQYLSLSDLAEGENHYNIEMQPLAPEYLMQTAFYVKRPNPYRRLKWKLKRLFRRWNKKIE